MKKNRAQKSRATVPLKCAFFSRVVEFTATWRISTLAVIRLMVLSHKIFIFFCSENYSKSVLFV
jgi:hypothetical protein